MAEAVLRHTLQRVAYSVVSKIVRTVFGEYGVTSRDPFTDQLLKSLAPLSRQAVEAALIGGSCYLKPCPHGTGFSFTLVPRNQESEVANEAISDEMTMAMLKYMPLRGILSFGGGNIELTGIAGLLGMPEEEE